jgi:hypothetical protein
MAAERKRGSDRGRAALDWNQAFLFYAGLPPEQRSYAAVAAEFGVSARTVERHGRKERWRERAHELDREATATDALNPLARPRSTVEESNGRSSPCAQRGKVLLRSRRDVQDDVA